MPTTGHLSLPHLTPHGHRDASRPSLTAEIIARFADETHALLKSHQLSPDQFKARGEWVRERGADKELFEQYVNQSLGYRRLPAYELPARESQPYYPLPVEQLWRFPELISLNATDTLIDLGSGSGRVLWNTHFLTGARTIGVEKNPVLVKAAREMAEQFSGYPVTTRLGDFCTEPLGDATVLFAFAPCFGRMWEDCVRNIERTARERPIRVVTYGPTDIGLESSPLFSMTTVKGFRVFKS